ncbi:hypothetical protein N7512_010174 [Penicillium capsulatum]|nr:hypothetical protein N7512_010174 [Penicillium capsulatum]
MEVCLVHDRRGISIAIIDGAKRDDTHRRLRHPTSPCPPAEVLLAFPHQAGERTSLEVELGFHAGQSTLAMALAVAKAAHLKAEVRLGQAISEFVADLSDEQKARFNIRRSQALLSPPTIQDVRSLTAEIDRVHGGRCLGPRLIKVVEAVQKFAALGDILVGGSQNIIACGVWSMMLITNDDHCVNQLMTNFCSHLERLSILFMNVGRSAPRIERIALLYSRSGELQSHVYEYFIVVVGLCHEMLKFTKKSAIMKFGAALSDSRLEKYKSDLDSLGNAIEDEARALMHKRSEEEGKANSHFRSMSAKFFKSASQQHVAQARQRVLDFCSRHDYMVAWKQARKTGNTHLFRDCPDYNAWKASLKPSTLVYTGKLGSGKSVMLANMVDDLHLFASGTNITVAFFFVRHDVSESLETQTIIGSIVQQLLSPFLDLTMADQVLATTSRMEPFERMVQLLKAVLKSEHKAFVVIDGLDELKTYQREKLLRDLHLLQRSFDLSLCFSFRQEPVAPLNTGLRESFENANITCIPDNALEIKKYIIEELDRRLESRQLKVGDFLLPLEIRDALVKGSQGMFLWTALQIDSLCMMDTDEEIRNALDNLPKDLSETFSRILQRSNKPGSPYQKWILELIVVARRQLTTEELKEALGVTPGDPNWNSSRLLNDIYSTLSCCGSLVIIDEEESTLRLVHHSAKKFLVGELDNPASVVVDVIAAHKRMSGIIITYLYQHEFGKQVATNVVPEIDAGPALTGIIRSTRHSMDDISNLALKLLRIESPREHNIIGKTLARTWLPTQNTGTQALFRGYAMECWHCHLAWSLPLPSEIQHLFQKLCERKIPSSLGAPEDVQPLFAGALMTGAIELVRYLIETCNVDVNCRLDSEESTPLHFAVKFGRIELMQVLLESRNIDVRLSNIRWETPMHLAADTGQSSLIMPFINAGKVDDRPTVLSPIMYQAATDGDISLVGSLIDYSKKNATHGTTVWTAIEGAVLGNQAAVVLFLASHQDTPDYKVGTLEENPLHKAIRHGSLQITEFLLQSGKVDHRAADSEEWTPLFLAACYEHEKIFKLLFDMESLNESHKAVMEQDIRGLTPLHMAAIYGSKAVIELAIVTYPGLNLNHLDWKGNTILHLAVKYSKKDVVELLVSNATVDIDIPDYEEGTPLKTAIAARDSAILGAILKFYPISSDCESLERKTPGDPSVAGRDTTGEKGHLEKWELGVDPLKLDLGQYTPLHYAAEIGNKPIVKILLQSVPGSHMPYHHKSGAFHLAIASGRIDVVQAFLADRPSLAHFPNQGGEFPLHTATMKGQLLVMKLLLEIPTSVHAIDNNRQTPLHHAALNGDDEAAALLLSYGADPSAQAIHDSTPLHYAARKDAVAAAKALLQHDKRKKLVNLQDDRGRTALHIAAIEGQGEIVRLLNVWSADMRIRDDIGCTALEHALRNDHQMIARFLSYSSELYTADLLSPPDDLSAA